MRTMIMDGGYEPAFERVAGVFREILADVGDRGGAAVAVYRDGRAVVDLVGGVADPRDGRPWRHDTSALIFSCTKALAATCIHAAAEAGDVDLDRPIADYWAEFGGYGKDRITARMVLAHQAGLPALDADLNLADVLATEPVLRALERQRPLWVPGGGHSYHAMTFGWILDEVLARATGRSLADHFERRFGWAGETWLGVPSGHRLDVAYATWDPARSNLVFPPDRPGIDPLERALTRGITLGSAFSPRLVGGRADLNDPEIQRHGLPALGALSTASGLARIWHATVRPFDGRPPLLGSRSIADATTVLAEGAPALGNPPPWPRWSSGYMVDSDFSPMLSASSFGHDGAGGQLAFADVETGVGFAFLTNDLRNVKDDRARRLVAELKASLRITDP